MTRSTVAVDRLATAIIGLLLVAGGAAVLLWDTALIDDIPEYITAPGPVSAFESSWWPWASAGVGVVLVLVALRWLVAHRPASKIDRASVAGEKSNTEVERTIPGRATADVTALASASARALETYAAIKKASAKAVIDRRQRTIVINATAESPELLGEAGRAADQVARDAVTMIGDSSLATRTVIYIEKRHKATRTLN